MSDLLSEVLEAHGGLEAWRTVRALRMHAAVTGTFWARHGWPDALADHEVTVDTTRQRIRYSAFGADRIEAGFDVDHARTPAERVWFGDGTVVGDPRPGFSTAYTLDDPWTAAQTVYFAAYGFWTYLNEPFLFTWPGVTAHEIEPWDEGGETWRRLAVHFSDDIVNHNADQVFYYDAELRQRRMDYHPDITAGPVAHYTFDHERFDGFLVPTRREVHRRLPDNTADPATPITVRLGAVEVLS